MNHAPLILPEQPSGPLSPFEQARLARSETVGEPSSYLSPLYLRHTIQCRMIDRQGRVDPWTSTLHEGAVILRPRQGRDFSEFWVFECVGSTYITRNDLQAATQRRLSTVHLAMLICTVLGVIGIVLAWVASIP